MQKKSLLALLLALMMLLSGCALVTVDTEKDNARTIIDVNGETVNKKIVHAIVHNQLEMNQYYSQLYASYGITGGFSTDEGEVTKQVIESFVQQLVSKQKAKELGLYEMTEEETAEIETAAQENYNSFLDSVGSTYLPGLGLEGDEMRAAAEKYAAENKITTVDGKTVLDDFIQAAKDDKAIQKLDDYMIKDVVVTDEEIQADYDAKVEADKAAYEADPNAYSTARTNGTTVYYAPAGYRMIKHILVPLTSEDTTAMTEKETALSAAQTALTNAQTALDEAAEDADKTALQTALDEAKKAAEEAQAAYNEAKDAAFAAIKGKADEIYEKAIAEDADFDALIAEYSTDNMPADGYAVREGGTTFVEPFTNAAMALANVGDVSEPVETTYGYHILKYVSDVEEGPVSLDSVRDTIASSLLSTKQSETITATRAQYVSEANVKTYEDRMD